MGRLAYMQRFPLWKAALAIAMAVFLSSCGDLGSPVSVADRPLSEKVSDREADTTTTTLQESDSDGAPEAIAFSEVLASGDFLRLNVTTNGVDTSLRAGPGTNYELVTDISNGSEVLATGNQTGEWVYVVFGDKEGWVSNRRLGIGGDANVPQTVPADQVERNPIVVRGDNIVYEVFGNASGVNIRTAPGGSANRAGGASLGEQLVGTGEIQGGWIEITTPDGVQGWVFADFLREIE